MVSARITSSDIFPADTANGITTDDAAILAQAAEISPHLSWLFRQHGEDLAVIRNGGSEDILRAAKAQLNTAITAAEDDAGLMAAIRQYRSRINHLVAVTDLTGGADIHQHMAWLTMAAETALRTLADALAGDETTRQNWFILALGKLGAKELNYSSDIDLIVITLNDHDDYDAAKKYVRLTRQITSLMSQPTKDGLGWRVDLRLRPDPGATPVAIQRDAALSYYESLARTWERAAFIRARPVAGNLAAGQAFLDDLKPFIWRRYLDYTVLDDLKIMLRREARPDDLLGYNIKNGIGGIRSIEFFVHAQQLIAGGREAELRVTSTPAALKQLAQNDWISPEFSESLTSAYALWRRLEHRLQMIGDAQTHQMPKSEEAFRAIATLCGHDDPELFRQHLMTLGDEVITATKGLLERLSGQNQPAEDDLPYISEDIAASHERLEKLGFTNPQAITSTCDGWLAGRIAATRSPRSRDLLAKLLPRLLLKFAEQESPDTGFVAFAQLVERLPAGLQLFALIDSHDDIAEMIVDIVSSAPVLAQQISRYPMLADALLYQSFWQVEENWPEREAELTRLLDELPFYEDQLSALRRQCREWQFRTSAQLLRGGIDGARAGLQYTAIADVIIRCALPVVTREMTRRFGQITGGGIAIYALGRCGAQEMTLTSDLDLVFIFDIPPDSQSEGGARSLMGSQYYSRFGQELINALSSPTAEGKCFEVDMRLRPSGNKGPVAIHIDGFEHYQRNDAWTWEHMALIKSRFIGGVNPDAITTRMEALVPAVVKSLRDTATLIDDVAAMQSRLKAAAPAMSARDLRGRDGGIMDIDFLTQMMQMSPDAQDLPITRRALDAVPLLRNHGALTDDEAETLTSAIITYTELIQWMRLTGVRTQAVETPEIPLPPSVQRRFGKTSFQQLDDELDQVADPISAIVKKYVCKDSKKA
ncbi:MAG: bifunctional [glutamine synthetase] adenylyltransferase/[glutamine synthetase]-adenylyl-L-tyrosine phosphorylase [Alphaproteobacteria bacterium]|nr:bifunctional [glutamine synthetase] adenylyltransferase/[glutamine synthetase]-adenylyl-L-tyrosine phosphorylase [Alphaproteobacteria bacterium]